MKGSYTDVIQEYAAKAFDDTVNVDETERLVSAIGGAAILLTSADLRSLRGLLATLMGASLIYRGVSGHCGMYSVLGIQTCSKDNGKSRSGSNSGSRQRETAGAR